MTLKPSHTNEKDTKTMNPLLKETAIPEIKDHDFLIAPSFMADPARFENMTVANDVQPTARRPLLERRRKRWTRRATR
jgi:hypothetical protein